MERNHQHNHARVVKQRRCCWKLTGTKKRYLLYKVLSAAVCILTAVSCTAKARIQLTHLQGRLDCMRNDWDAATLHFFTAEAAAKDLQDSSLQTYAACALGSVYLLQNEEYAALEKFETAIQKGTTEIKTHSLYQKGIIAFKKQDYSGAAALFKQALALDSNDMDAKINYELSKKLCIRVQEAQKAPPHQSTEQQDTENPEDSIILDIMKKRELMKWKKMQHDPQPAINDY